MNHDKLIAVGFILSLGILMATGCISGEMTPGNETETDEYTLTINTEGEGSTNPMKGNHTYEEGEEATITAEPGKEWMFLRWEGDHETLEKETTITMNEDKTLTSIFLHLNETDVDEGCKEDIRKAVNQSRGQTCTQQYKELTCPHGEFTYGAKDGCEISYLEKNNWTEKKLERTIVKETTENESCGWVSTNCCPPQAGANWECVNTEETVIECPENPICPQVVVGEPTGNCTNINGTCTVKNTTQE